MLKKADIIFLACIVCVAVFTLLWLFGKRYIQSETGEKYVVIYIDKEPYETLPLNLDTELLLPTEDGYSELVVSGGCCYMKSAHCPDQICVKHKAISLAGESIICLPYRIVVTIEGDGESAYDN